jgi:hypothetical protein
MGAIAAPVQAHHSAAMFDTTRVVVLEGVVKSFQWTNPHSWLHMTVSNKAGKQEVWSIEMPSPAILSRVGWKPRWIKPGDKVSATIHPRRDGTFGGDLEEVVLADGTTRTVGRGGVSRGD